MKKVSVSATNDLCPQTLFVYGSMNEDGRPDMLSPYEDGWENNYPWE